MTLLKCTKEMWAYLRLDEDHSLRRVLDLIIVTTVEFAAKQSRRNEDKIIEDKNGITTQQVDVTDDMYTELFCDITDYVDNLTPEEIKFLATKLIVEEVLIKMQEKNTMMTFSNMITALRANPSVLDNFKKTLSLFKDS